jgi:hypothetical protein
MGYRERVSASPELARLGKSSGSAAPSLSARYEESPFRGSVGFCAGVVTRDMLGPSLGLTLRALRGGPPVRLSKFDPVQSICHCGGRMPERTSPKAMARRAEGRTPGVNREGSPITSLSARQEKSPAWGLVSCLAEREGFEPSIELLTLYTLSRGAPSTTRPSLRICFSMASGSQRSAKDTRRGSRGKAQDSPTAPACSSSGFCSRLMRW